MSKTQILKLDGISVAYEQVIQAVRGVSIHVPKGDIIALLGANGAGKTSIMKAIFGLVRAERGEITAGTITYKSHEVTNADPRKLVENGLVQVLEGRHCFQHLTVEENLISGSLIRKLSGKEVAAELDRIYAFFPRLKTRRKSLAGYTSGGEQQMVAIGRALMAKPDLILLDEPSMGLAPQVVEEIFEIVYNLKQQANVSFLLAEQNANIALRYADYGYIIENGQVVLEGRASDLLHREDVQSYYLGVGEAGRQSFRDTKHYHRKSIDLNDVFLI